MNFRKLREGILFVVLIGHVTGGGVEWPQCDSEGCQDPDLELMISSLEKAVSSMQVGETDLLGVMNDVQRMRDVKSPYIYPPLTRIEPEQVGEKVEIELLPGRSTHRITRSIDPPIFEITHFLSPSECETLKKAGTEKGLNLRKDTASGDDKGDTPVAKAVFLDSGDLEDEFLMSIDQRIAAVTGLPVDVISRSDLPQIGLYHPGGPFHAHFDTTLADSTNTLPCCFQTPHCNKRKLPVWQYKQCCKRCSYITLIMYLNDVEEGGETAFPLADQSDEYIEEMSVHERSESGDHLMLTVEECASTKVKVKPKRGSAVFWYNHIQDEETGYLGPGDETSYHGACGVIKGTKWIGAFLVSGAHYNQRQDPSKYGRNWL